MEREVAVGGSSALGELIDRHGAALYADFLTVYGIDLIAFVAGETRHTPRIVLSLIEHLPEGTAFPASYAGDMARRSWRSDHSLLAAIHNAIQVNTMVTAPVAQKDRKHFAFIDPPWMTKAKSAPAAVKKSALAVLGGALPESLRAKKTESE